MVSHVKDNNPLGTRKTVSLDFDEELAREDRQGNLKILQMINAQYLMNQMYRRLPCRNTQLHAQEETEHVQTRVIYLDTATLENAYFIFLYAKNERYVNSGCKSTGWHR